MHELLPVIHVVADEEGWIAVSAWVDADRATQGQMTAGPAASVVEAVAELFDVVKVVQWPWFRWPGHRWDPVVQLPPEAEEAIGQVDQWVRPRGWSVVVVPRPAVEVD